MKLQSLLLYACCAALLAACTSVTPETELNVQALSVQQIEAEAKRVIKDPEAEGGEAAILYSTDQKATFQLAEVPAGRYKVSVKARADEYKGWPLMRLERDGKRLGEDNLVERTRYGEGAQRFGEADFEAGQVITATFTNDLYGGSEDKDRNLIVDYLILEPVSEPVSASPAAPQLGSDALMVSVGEARALKPDHFGFNNDQTIRGVERDDEAYNEAMKSLSPGTLRFPGGTSANYWDWERADFVCGKGETYQIVDKESRPCVLPNGYQSLNPPAHTLEALKTELGRTGADAVFVLNMLTRRAGQTESNLSSALRMLKEAERLGIEVKYIELGNEFYLTKGNRDASSDYEVAFPDVEAYIQEARTWLAALREDFPEAKIAAVGADKRPNQEERRNTWNRAAAEALAGQVDALTIHTYSGGRGDLSSLLASPQRRTDNLKKNEFNELPEDLPLWITEYNLFDRETSSHGTWSHGLFAATQTLSLLQENRVELSHFHSGIGNAVFGSTFLNDAGFDYGNTSFPAPENPPTTVPYGLTASGQTLQLVGGAMRGATSAKPLAFDEQAPTIKEGQPGLVGWLFEGAGQEVVLLNLSGAEQTLNLKDVARGSFVQRSADLDLRVTGAAKQVKEVTGDMSATLKLSAYSITRVSAE